MDGEDIREELSDEKMNHLRYLTPMIDELLAQGGFTLKDMDAIAVSTGPGSFTGIRIGVSTARGLSQVSGIPLIAVPTLFAFGCSEYEGNREGTVCPLFNARRGQVYAGAYNDFCEVIPGGPYMLDEFLEMVFAWQDGFGPAEEVADTDSSGKKSEIKKRSGKLLMIGDGVDAYAEKIKELCAGRNFEMRSRYQDAAGVCEMAADMMRDPATFGDRLNLTYDRLEPEYMRMTEAEQRLRDGTLGKGIAGKSNG